MDRKEQIRKGLITLAGKHGPLQTVLAKVVSVDETEMTCELIDDEDEDGLEMYDVRLKPVLTTDESLVMIPAVGSWVLVTRVEEDEDWLVIACEKVDKWRVTVGASVLEVTQDGFSFKQGATSLKTVMDDLLDGIMALTVPTNVGPSGTPLNLTTFQQVKTQLDQILK
jgi:hypothetical protein